MPKAKELPGRTVSVNRMCRECQGCDYYRGEKIGTPPQKAAAMVRECTDTECPLYYFRNGSDERPGRTKRKVVDK